MTLCPGEIEPATIPVARRSLSPMRTSARISGFGMVQKPKRSPNMPAPAFEVAVPMITGCPSLNSPDSNSVLLLSLRPTITDTGEGRRSWPITQTVGEPLPALLTAAFSPSGRKRKA